MRYTRIALLLAAFLAIVALSTGCRKKPVETTPPPPPPPPPVTQKAAPPPPVEVTEDFKAPEPVAAPIVEPSLEELSQNLRTVYFDFDKSDLDAEDRAILQANAQWLKANRNRTIRIEGHCDERGTIEYNLALGERRASAVRDYLTSLGVSLSQMRIVSYGEEQPANPGSGEAAWAQNRRAEFWVES